MDLKSFTDISHPLLEKCKTVAPGTYAHSITVSALCEPIAKDLELDHDIMKCSALYHDIGKIYYPQYYTENQNGCNPHDELDPYLSYIIITSHVSNSIALLIEHNMPDNVIKIIAEHHGDTILKPIFEKCKSKCENICEDMYRYKHNKPSNVYSSILMITDIIAAAAVSKQFINKLSTLEERTNLVQNTICRLENERQLDELKTGQKLDIQNRLIRELESMIQKRDVSYPEEDTKDGSLG